MSAWCCPKAKLQASVLCGQVAEYTAHHRACGACGVLQPLKDRRMRRVQTLFGTVEVEAPRFKLRCCRLTAPIVEVTVWPVCALLTARSTPELERVQAELGARTSFRDAARILDSLLPASPVQPPLSGPSKMLVQHGPRWGMCSGRTRTARRHWHA